MMSESTLTPAGIFLLGGDGMDWLLPSLFSVVVGVIAFFLKKTMANSEKAMEEFKTEMKALRADSDAQLVQMREDFRKENAAIREDFRASMDSHGKRIDKLETAVSDMPYKYTLKEDFIRSMNAVDKKLDTIIDSVKKGG